MTAGQTPQPPAETCIISGQQYIRRHGLSRELRILYTALSTVASPDQECVDSAGTCAMHALGMVQYMGVHTYVLCTMYMGVGMYVLFCGNFVLSRNTLSVNNQVQGTAAHESLSEVCNEVIEVPKWVKGFVCITIDCMF